MALLPIVLAAVLIFAAACGGDDDTSSGSPQGNGDAPATATQELNGGESTPAGPQTPSDGGSVVLVDEGLAQVTVGDSTFEFNMSAACLASFGAVGGSGSSTDGSDISIDITIAPPDITTSAIRIVDDREERRVVWEADVEAMDNFLSIEAGQSQVDDLEIEGGAASGTATFIDTFAILLGETPEPVQGTFAINCGG